MSDHNISPVLIEEEVQKSYIDYAMSVIIGRALPDARDGLKPVHRRILYTMYNQGNLAGKPYKKSARIVGEVMGKYHPHGDMAIYDAMVRMAQDFSMRYPLVDGQGNFGSVDGDSAAAMRYTEVRLTKLAEELMKGDIDKDTVDWQPNYDGSMIEPVILPGSFPNLLINGSSGIAVGMSTNIPPHNLSEVIRASIMVMDNPETTQEQILQALPGPDFPTGGIINGTKGIIDAYTTGRGSIQIRAKATVEILKNDRQRLVVTEIPFQVNKASLVMEIADLVKNKKLDGIQDIRDESNREGIRVVLDLKKSAVPEVILNFLYRHTQMQTNFSVQILAILNQQPRLFNIKRLLQAFISHRKMVVVRRTRFDLAKAQERAHILEGLKIALDNLDDVIKLIRASKDVETARSGLMTEFKLTRIQADAILEMRLQKLTGLERQKIMDEYTEILKTIEELKAILKSESMVRDIIRNELSDLSEKFGDERRTEIQFDQEQFSLEDTIPEEDMVITISHRGYIKRTPLTTYRSQRRGGKGRLGMATRAEDFVEHLYVASTHDYMLFFTEEGRLYWLKVYDLPEVGAAARGIAIVNLLRISMETRIADVQAVREFDPDRFLQFVTKKGTIKRTSLDQYSNVRKGGIQAIRINEDDSLLDVSIVDSDDRVLLATHQGFSILFPVKDVRPMGRVASGVKGISLRSEDEVVGVVVAEDSRTVLTVCEGGYGKRTAISEYRLQSRGGKGIINVRITEKNGPVVGVLGVGLDDQIMLITEHGQLIRTACSEISQYHRNSQGVRLVNVGAEDRVTAIAHLAEKEDNNEEAESEEEIEN